MTKPREKKREELQAEIEDGKKKIRQLENREKVLRQLLTFLFHDEAAQKKLNTLIEERRKTLTTGGSENPLF